MWQRRTVEGIQQLPEERKALAERYTIDAEEAQRREQLPAAVAAREAKELAQRAARALQQEARLVVGLPDDISLVDRQQHTITHHDLTVNQNGLDIARLS